MKRGSLRNQGCQDKNEKSQGQRGFLLGEEWQGLMGGGLSCWKIVTGSMSSASSNWTLVGGKEKNE